MAKWYSDSKYQMSIIHNPQNVYEAYTNEPFYINLNMPLLRAAARTDGLDIVFTDINGNLYPRIIVNFNRSDQSGLAIVQFPDNLTTIYMQWGGKTVNVANNTNTFPSAYVLSSLFDGSATDYSQNANNGTLSGSAGTPSSCSGILGNGLDLDQSDSQFISFGDQNYYSFGDGSTDNEFTIIEWVNADDITSFGFMEKYAVSNLEYQFMTVGGANDGKMTGFCWDDSSAGRSGRYYNTALTSDEGSWILVGMTYGGSSDINLYRNAIRIDDTDSNAAGYVAMEPLGAPLTVGRQNATNYANGKINAVRLISSKWSTNRFLTTYDNENLFSSNGAFSFGSILNKSPKKTTISVGVSL